MSCPLTLYNIVYSCLSKKRKKRNEKKRKKYIFISSCPRTLTRHPSPAQRRRRPQRPQRPLRVSHGGLVPRCSARRMLQLQSRERARQEMASSADDHPALHPHRGAHPPELLVHGSRLIAPGGDAVAREAGGQAGVCGWVAVCVLLFVCSRLCL